MTDLATLDDQLGSVSLEEKKVLLDLWEELQDAQQREGANSDFLAFVKQVWPAFIEGEHHRIMADAFNKIAEGKLKRLIINMPPRHTKSEFASHLFPAWYLGKFPDRKVIQTSHTAELAVGFGRKVRNLVGSADYSRIFPGVALRCCYG